MPPRQTRFPPCRPHHRLGRQLDGPRPHGSPRRAIHPLRDHHPARSLDRPGSHPHRYPRRPRRWPFPRCRRPRNQIRPSSGSRKDRSGGTGAGPVRSGEALGAPEPGVEGWRGQRERQVRRRLVPAKGRGKSRRCTVLDKWTVAMAGRENVQYPCKYSPSAHTL